MRTHESRSLVSNRISIGYHGLPVASAAVRCLPAHYTGILEIRIMAAMTPQTVLAMCRERDVKAVDLRFMDFPGLWQHFTIPVGKLDEDVFEDGLGFDGSSIRGWQAINESDMLVVPQPDTAFLDPFTAAPDAVR